MPYGVLAPLKRFAMRVQRYMYEHGVRQEAMQAIALASYHHAQSNPRAVMFGKPLDPGKYNASRWIAEPFHLYDCCMENDGAAAIILVPEERAGDFEKNKPAYILGAAVGAGYRSAAIPHNSPQYASASFETLAPALYRMAGIGPSHVDVVQSYENFTGGVVMALAEHGFFKPEEANDFLTLDNLIAPAGRLPLNTSGGNLAECYMHGFLLGDRSGAPDTRPIGQPGQAKRRSDGDRRTDGNASQQPSCRFGSDAMNDTSRPPYLSAGLPIPVPEPDGLSAPYWALVGGRTASLRSAARIAGRGNSDLNGFATIAIRSTLNGQPSSRADASSVGSERKFRLTTLCASMARILRSWSNCRTPETCVWWAISSAIRNASRHHRCRRGRCIRTSPRIDAAIFVAAMAARRRLTPAGRATVGFHQPRPALCKGGRRSVRWKCGNRR